MKNKTFTLDPADNQRLQALCGELNENIHIIERHLAVEVGNRGHNFKIIGPEDSIEQAQNIIVKLYDATKEKTPSRIELNQFIQEAITTKKSKQKEKKDKDGIVLELSKQSINPRGANQRRYVKRILDNDISFGIGPAGTGKTFLAVACAVAAFEQKQVQRIILVRPAVEAGESLGFLPGDLSQKVDPYLRPIYDALYELMGVETVLKLIERNIIEIAPLAYMRGRSLNDSFIILDEGQNTTRDQMKMFLTRLGFNSKAVITGDITQVDLPRNDRSGLRHVINVLSGAQNGISFTFFDSQDVVRHPLIQKVIEAYEKHEHDN